MRWKITRALFVLFGLLVSAMMLGQYAHAGDSSLITYWKFDEPAAGSTVIDSSGSGFSGTPHGVNSGSDDPALLPQPSIDVPPTTFSDSHSLFFQGDGGNSTGGYVDVSDWNIDTSNGFTVSLWAKPTTSDGSSWERFMDFGNGPGSDNIVFAQNGGTSQVYFEVYNGGSTTKIFGPDGSWMVGSWHLYTTTIDADGNATIYIDGNPVATGTTNKPLNIARSDKYIGKSNWGDDYYQGYMDDFRFYDRALTPAEVTDLSNGNPGPGVPVSDNGIPSGVENAAPNNGDANDDGTADSQQSNVGSFVDNQTGKYISVAAPSACTLSSLSAVADAAQTEADAGYTYPVGLANYTASCGTNGYTADITMYFYGVTGQGMVLRKHNPTTKTYSTVSGATISQVAVGGQEAAKVVYQVTDGGPLDTDGAANGVIVDPVGLARTATTLTDTGTNVVAIDILATAFTAIGALVVIRHQAGRV